MNSEIIIKPVFVGWISLVAQLPLQIFGTLWASMFLGGMMGGEENDLSQEAIIAVVTFLAIPLLLYTAKKYNYRSTVYKIFDDHLEMEEGFLTVQQKSVRFKDVREVTLHKGLLQRSANLGSVYLATQATGTANARPFSLLGMSLASGSGFTLRDIENANEIYQKLKSVMEAQA